MTTLLISSSLIHGPTWTRAHGKFIQPAVTIGDFIAAWCEEYLVQPDGPEAGQPWRFTNEQLRFVYWWYAVDANFRFLYRAGLLRRMKGWGKDPLAVALAAAELLGPCRPVRRNGRLAAEPQFSACVQVAAVSQDQVKRNTMSLFPAMVSAKARREYDMDIGKEIVYAHGGRCRVELLTTSFRSTEGPRPTFVVKNEVQHWLPANGGDDMSEVISRNAAKSRDGSTRVLALANAHAPGEGSDAERDYEAYLQQPDGFLYDSLEAPYFEDLADTEMVKSAISVCRGDSTWLDIDRLTAEVVNVRYSESMRRRYYFNQLAASEDLAFNGEKWDENARLDYRPAYGALISLGFDGSQTRDHTALIATEIATGFQWVAGYWEPALKQSGDYEIPVPEVNATIADCFERYNVFRLNADPYWWKEQLSLWAGRYNKPGKEIVVSYSTTLYRKMALALQVYADAIKSGALTHSGDPRFTRAIKSAHKNLQNFRDDYGEQMWILQKEHPDSALKIDAAMAGCLSWEARMAAISAGALEQPESKGFSLYVPEAD